MSLNGFLPEVEPHIVKGALFAGVNFNVFIGLQIRQVSLLQSPPEHVDAPFEQRQNRGVAGTEKFEDDAVNMGSQSENLRSLFPGRKNVRFSQGTHRLLFATP